MPFSKLFNTVAFKIKEQENSQWLQVQERNKQQPFDTTQIKEETSKLTGVNLLTYINKYWNSKPYRKDSLATKYKDVWSTPYEFNKYGGDCEDYSIAKYFTLRDLGIDAEDMRIVIIKDNIKGFVHAILAVNLNGEIYILDNLKNNVFIQDSFSSYVPCYSMNENSRYMHIVPIEKESKKKKK